MRLIARRFRIGTLLGLAASLPGCTQPGSVPYPLNTASPLGPQSAILLPASTYHLVSVRSRPAVAAASSAQDVFCSEPSPDWAVAYGRTLSGGASGGGGGITAAFNVTTTTPAKATIP